MCREKSLTVNMTGKEKLTLWMSDLMQSVSDKVCSLVGFWHFTFTLSFKVVKEMKGGWTWTLNHWTESLSDVQEIPGNYMNFQVKPGRKTLICEYDKKEIFTFLSHVQKKTSINIQKNWWISENHRQSVISVCLLLPVSVSLAVWRLVFPLLQYGLVLIGWSESSV